MTKSTTTFFAASPIQASLDFVGMWAPVVNPQDAGRCGCPLPATRL
ncbi:MAG: hypothetical protein O2894_12110 [Planctomycetota bacterium]|nr:hypothetical protein [Planctomycetota bacterium]